MNACSPPTPQRLITKKQTLKLFRPHIWLPIAMREHFLPDSVLVYISVSVVYTDRTFDVSRLGLTFHKVPSCAVEQRRDKPLDSKSHHWYHTESRCPTAQTVFPVAREKGSPKTPAAPNPVGEQSRLTPAPPSDHNAQLPQKDNNRGGIAS